MPARIPWMTSSLMKRKKTPAMAVSLSLELEGEEGQQEAGPSSAPHPPQDTHRPEMGSPLPLEMGRDSASTLISSV